MTNPLIESTELKLAQQERERETARRIAAKLSRGNVSLQRGNFETAQELEACRKSLENYEF